MYKQEYCVAVRSSLGVTGHFIFLPAGMAGLSTAATAAVASTGGLAAGLLGIFFRK